MTPALLRASKTKSKLHAAFIKTPILATKQKYVTCRNKFKTLRNKMEKNYYAAEFVKHSHNLKQTWHTIKSMLSDALIKLIVVNGAEITGSGLIAEKFNNYFTGLS